MAETHIFFVLALMLIAAIIGFLLSKRFKQPVSVGIIIIGILLGPSLLGIATYDDLVAVMAQLGSIILLFIAGLHSNLEDIYTKKNALIAFFGALIPVVGGLLTGLAFGYPLYASVFIGVTLSATCLGITSAVLKELGKIQTPTAKAMIGAAVIDDIISLTLLSLVLSVPQGVGVWQVIGNVLLIVLFILLMLFFGQTIVTWIVDRFNDRVLREAPKLTFVLGLSIVFLFSYLTSWLGLAPIVGAFLIGVSLAKSRAINTLLAGSEYFEIVFTSIFFIVIGIVVEVQAFLTTFWFIVSITVVAILAKLIGAGLPAYAQGFSFKDAVIIGTGMAPRGEVAFIIALNGLLLGVVTTEVYSAMVFMSFFTTVIALVALKGLYSGEKGGRRAPEIGFVDVKVRR